MKKFTSFLLSLFMIFAAVAIPASAEEGIRVMLDGTELVFDVQPQLINDRTMVPMRKIFEAFGAVVEWDNETKTVMAMTDNVVVVLQINSTTLCINDKKISLDVAPQLINDRTLVPLRAIAESFDAEVLWNGDTKTVTITTVHPTMNIDQIYTYPDPVIDFSNDDGLMGAMHCTLRYYFEQAALPETLFANQEQLGALLVNDPEAFLAFIDNEVWTKSMNTVVLNYLIGNEETYLFETAEAISSFINKFADKYALHAYQSYSADAIKLDDKTYCCLLSLADLSTSKAEEMDKMLISSYIAIVYNADTKQFSYYLLEKSFNNLYAFCSVDQDGSHSTHTFIDKDKKAFVETVKLYCN